MDPRLMKNSLGFWEIIEKPSTEELKQYYGKKYFQEVKCDTHEYSLEELQYLRAKFEQRLAVIQRYIGDRTVTMLDVGCGEGYNLAYSRGIGWSVKGFDFSSAGVQSKNPDCLDALITGNVYQLLAEEASTDNSYDVIWLQNVLEHVIDPIELLETCRTILSPEGIAVVTVPNDYSIAQIAAREYQHINTDFWVALPDHLNYFTSESLCNVAEATGWKCVELLADFPIDWFLFHPGSNYVRDKGVGKAAHRARVQLETIIHQQPIDDVINFWSALAKIGFGRDITAFLQPARCGKTPGCK